MKKQQADFKEEYEVSERTILNFSNYQDLKEHEKIYGIVISLNEQIVIFKERALMINKMEDDFEVERTDYKRIEMMQKEFVPYANLWIAAHKWELGYKSWMNDEWDMVDAEAAEKTVEESTRNLNAVIRFMNDRQIPNIYKIAETVKAQFDEFKPKVPLLVALRKKGMNERHWNQISELVGEKIFPGEGFTFKIVLGKL